jgi:dTDP-6-deoxy-L-talose 4-dehydrogenase (NAD+)
MSLDHFEVHLRQQYEFIKALIVAGLPRVVCAGTCLEYGNHSGQLNEVLDTRPITPYGFAKDALRRQLQFLAREMPFELTWARLFYMYGDGQPTTSLYPQLKAALSNGDSSFAMSSGEQLRDYLPVESVSKLLVALALCGMHAEIVNVCSGTPISVRSLVEKWLRESERKIELHFGKFDLPAYEPLAFWGSNALLRSVLGEDVHSEITQFVHA